MPDKMKDKGFPFKKKGEKDDKKVLFKAGEKKGKDGKKKSPFDKF